MPRYRGDQSWTVAGITEVRGAFVLTENVVYTAIFGGYDTLLPQNIDASEIRQVVVSESRPTVSWGWEWLPSPMATRDLPPSAKNRWCKFFPHQLFPEAQYAVYLDGNVRTVNNPKPLMEQFVESGSDVGLFRHHQSSTLEQELESCFRNGKIGGEDVGKYAEIIQRYRAWHHRLDVEVTENTIIFQNLKSPRFRAAMDLWWTEYRDGIERDQISLPLVRLETDLKSFVWDWNFRNDNEYFSIPCGHRRKTNILSEFLFVLRVLRAERLRATKTS